MGHKYLSAQEWERLRKALERGLLRRSPSWERYKLDWSYSKSRMWKECPRKFFLSYLFRRLLEGGSLEAEILGRLKSFTSIPMLHGISLDASIMGLLEEQFNPNPDDLLRIYVTEVEKGLRGGLIERLNGIMGQEDVESKLSELRDIAYNSLVFFVNEVYPMLKNLKFLSLGRREALTYRKQGEYTFLFAPDLVASDEAGGWHIFDWKAAYHRAEGNDEVQAVRDNYDRFQVELYLTLAYIKHRDEWSRPTSASGHLVYLHSSHVESWDISSLRMKEVLSEVERDYRDMLDGIRENRFPQRVSEGCKYCRFYRLCHGDEGTKL